VGGTYEYRHLMFPLEYLDYLSNFTLPEYNLEKAQDGQYRLEFEGEGSDYWEIPALMIITTLLGRSRMKRMPQGEVAEFYKGARERLFQKIEAIRRYRELAPKRGWQKLVFSDFGTRRCFSPEWQEHVVQTLKEELPEEFKGTSNCYLAKKYDLMPTGTNAHRTQMKAAALAEAAGENVAQSQFDVYKKWMRVYPTGALWIILSDTYGSPFFYKNAPPELAKARGVRGDSGDLLDEGERAIKWFERHGEDPSQKLYIISDALTWPTIFRSLRHFSGSKSESPRIPTTPGWGSNLTNHMTDNPGFKPISAIIKPVSVNGVGAVKLSNNRAKATGKKEDVERYIGYFDYEESYFEPCTY